MAESEYGTEGGTKSRDRNALRLISDIFARGTGRWSLCQASKVLPYGHQAHQTRAYETLKQPPSVFLCFDTRN